MNIAISCDDKYAKYSMVTLESLMRNYDKSSEELLTVFVVANDLSVKSIDEMTALAQKYNAIINPVYMKDEFLEKLIEAEVPIGRFTLSAWYRIFLPFLLLDEVKEVIYLDCDILIRDDLSDITELFNPEKCIMACCDMNCNAYAKRIGTEHYINSGMLYMNLDRIRKMYTVDCICAEIKKISATDKLIFPDQDTINLLFLNEIEILPEKYNYQRLVNKGYSLMHLNEIRKVVVAHFVSCIKPWSPTYIFPYTFEYYSLLKKYLGPKERIIYWLIKPMGIVQIIKKHIIYCK